TSKPRTEKHGRVQCYKGFTLKLDIVKEKGLVQVVQPFPSLFQLQKNEKENFFSAVLKETSSGLDQFDQRSSKFSQKDLAEKLVGDYRDLDDPQDISLKGFAREESSRYDEDFERVKELLKRLAGRWEKPLIFSGYESDSSQEVGKDEPPDGNS
ncbi:hypothetical protein AKJ38_01780, partial [candidate division MSBL1 archaeon SCGC-AAA259I14]